MSDLLQTVRAFLAGDPAPPATANPPHPHAAWLLVCLMRQLVRQHWLLGIIGERLDRLRTDDEETDQGDVPGMAGWRYEFHGRGCCLTGPGEILDVDFYGDEGATIDPYFFAYRIFSLTEPGLPEARLAALLPGSSLVAFALRELRAEGLLGHPESTHVFRLAPELEALAETASAWDFTTREARERALVWMGDFEALDGSGSSPRARAAREARRDWLLSLASQSSTSKEALAALQEMLSPEAFARACEDLLAGPVTAATAEAIQKLDALPGSSGSEAVLQFMQRLSPLEHHPYSAHAAASFLLRRGIERERVVAMALAFARVDRVTGYGGNPFAGEFALLALEHDPEHALELVRRALRSSVPAVRAIISATLCALDQPWCQRELITALEESNRSDRGDAVYLQLALARSQSEWARAIAARWGRRNPMPPPSDFGFTHEEVMEACGDPFFDSQLKDAREWLHKVHVRTPDGAE